MGWPGQFQLDTIAGHPIRLTGALQVMDRWVLRTSILGSFKYPICHTKDQIGFLNKLLVSETGSNLDSIPRHHIDNTI